MAHIRSLYYIRGYANTCLLDTHGRKNLLSILPFSSIRSFRTSIIKKSRWPSRSSGTKKQSFDHRNSFNGVAVETEPVHLSKLWKPFCFTVLVGSGSFACAAIWQYENLRAKAFSLMKHNWFNERFNTKKYGSWRNNINHWWNSLTEGQRIFVPLCFINCLVFLAWRIPQFQGVMVRYFCSNPASKVLCWPMILSTYSHYSFFHLFANMLVLHSFSTVAVSTMGKEQFLGMYTSAGVISSFVSYFHKTLITQPGLSLGASGAIMAVLGYVCARYPDMELGIILLPFFTFPAGIAIKCMVAIDIAGLIRGWKFFDHAAHLGGATFGIGWFYWGESYIWQKRDRLLLWWHDIRSAPAK